MSDVPTPIKATRKRRSLDERELEVQERLARIQAKKLKADDAKLTKFKILLGATLMGLMKKNPASVGEVRRELSAQTPQRDRDFALLLFDDFVRTHRLAPPARQEAPVAPPARQEAPVAPPARQEAPVAPPAYEAAATSDPFAQYDLTNFPPQSRRS